MSMRVALLQIASPDDESFAGRRARVDAIIRSEGGLTETDLLVLPELWVAGAFRYDQFVAAAEPFEGPTLDLASSWAMDLDLYVHAGSFVEAEGDHRYNTSVVVSPAGEVILKYRKVHPFGRAEARLLSGGDQLAIGRIGDIEVGLATCYDLRFPELFRSIVDAGAIATVVASGWPTARAEHWQLFTSARAVEDQMYVFGCNAVGNQAGTELAGLSRVVDPWGTVIVEADAEEGFSYADIDTNLPSQVRERFPALADRRWAGGNPLA